MNAARLMDQVRSLPLFLRVAVGAVLVAGLSTNMAVRASALRASVPVQEARLQDMKRNAQEILQLRGSGVTARSLDPTSLGELERSAETSGLRSQVTSMTQSGSEGIAIGLEGASFNRILGWLDDLRLSKGIRVKRASIEDAANNGAVSARLVLE